MTDPLYKIALSFLPGVGPVLAKKLVSYLGGVKNVFEASKQKLTKTPGIGSTIAEKIIKSNALKKAEEELKIIENKDIEILFYLDKNYPKLLKEIEDAPILLYKKGNCKFDDKFYLSVVGTRKPTEYGKIICEKLIKDFVENDINLMIISGLAYGIDYCAHHSALSKNIETIAVLGHGFRYMYPAMHKTLSEKIQKNGCLLTEYPYNQKVEAKNFVKRNRIIAALGQALVVVQSAKKGGSLITAEYAIQYNRLVFTFPGRITDTKMGGCNYLIKTNRAALIESAKDIIYEMNLKPKKQQKQQKALFIELSAEEQKIVDFIKQKGTVNVDNISFELNLPINQVLTTLFNLEFKNIVKALPGRMYSLTI